MEGRILVAAMMATVALAGCVSDDGTSSTTETMSAFEGEPQINAAGKPVWIIDQDGVELDAEAFDGDLPVFDQRFITNRRSGEPTVGITSSGAVFYAAIEFDVGSGAAATSLPRTFYFRSYDAGLTWDDVTPDIAGEVPTHPESGDPYVHVDPDTDRIFAMDMTPSVACNKVSYSDNDGDTWVLANPTACPLPGADHPTLFTGPKVGPQLQTYEANVEARNEACAAWNDAGVGDLEGCPVPLIYRNNVYLCSNQVAQAKCAYSLDGGRTWATAPAVFPGVLPEADPAYATDCVSPDDPENPFASSGPDCLENVCSGFTSHGTTDRNDGTVYVPRALCDRPVLAISTNGGMSYEWDYLFPDEAQYAAEPRVHDTMVAVDDSGTLYYFWLGNQGATANLVVSEDKGQTWSDVHNVTAPGVTAAKFGSIVAGADGRIAFQYVGTTNPRGHAVGSDLREEDGSWNQTNLAIWENATWDAYAGISVNADGDDPVFAVTTVNDPADPLKRGACSGRCFGDDGGMYDFLDIEVDPVTGRIYSAIVDVCNDECENDPDADAWYYQRATGDLGVQLAGPRLWDGTEADR